MSVPHNHFHLTLHIHTFPVYFFLHISSLPIFFFIFSSYFFLFTHFFTFLLFVPPPPISPSPLLVQVPPIISPHHFQFLLPPLHLTHPLMTTHAGRENIKLSGPQNTSQTLNHYSGEVLLGVKHLFLSRFFSLPFLDE